MRRGRDFVKLGNEVMSFFCHRAQTVCLTFVVFCHSCVHHTFSRVSELDRRDGDTTGVHSQRYQITVTYRKDVGYLSVNTCVFEPLFNHGSLLMFVCFWDLCLCFSVIVFHHFILMFLSYNHSFDVFTFPIITSFFNCSLRSVCSFYWLGLLIYYPNCMDVLCVLFSLSALDLLVIGQMVTMYILSFVF